MACLQLLNGSVEIFANLVKGKTANIFVCPSGSQDIFLPSGSLDNFGQPYQARRTDEKLDYKCQPALASGTTCHVRGNCSLKMLQNNHILQCKFRKDLPPSDILAIR